MKAVQSSRMVPAIFFGRWTPKVLFSLKEKPDRHGQLRRNVGSVSQRMLTRTLRKLALIARRVTRSKAIAVEYSLTRLGRTLISTQRYVPLGKTIPQGRECGSVTFASAPGAMSETWDLSLLRF
jgi:DNA-binding HxlR family transcriptional regulator